MEKKPWWKSKIALMGIVLAAVGVGNLAFGFVSGQGVTPDQIAAIQTNYPAIADNVRDAANGGNIFTAITGVGGALVSIWRIWYTNTLIGS